MHWIHENYVCKNCAVRAGGRCCGNNIENTTANFCKPDSPQGDNVLDHISQGNKIIITAICKRNIPEKNENNRCLALYDIVLTF